MAWGKTMEKKQYVREYHTLWGPGRPVDVDHKHVAPITVKTKAKVP